MSRRSDLLSDAQWEKIGPLLPELKEIWSNSVDES